MNEQMSIPSHYKDFTANIAIDNAETDMKIRLKRAAHTVSATLKKQGFLVLGNIALVDLNTQEHYKIFTNILPSNRTCRVEHYGKEVQEQRIKGTVKRNKSIKNYIRDMRILKNKTEGIFKLLDKCGGNSKNDAKEMGETIIENIKKMEKVLTLVVVENGGDGDIA